jgi:hypothetical protein
MALVWKHTQQKCRDEFRHGGRDPIYYGYILKMNLMPSATQTTTTGNMMTNHRARDAFIAI